MDFTAHLFLKHSLGDSLQVFKMLSLKSDQIFTLSGVHVVHACPVHASVRLLAGKDNDISDLFKTMIRPTCTRTCCPSPSGQEERVQERQDPLEELQGGRVDPSLLG